MCYLEYAQVFVSISTAGYHYIQNPQSLCHTQIGLLDIVENKTQIFQLFKEVYTRLGLYDEMAAKIYKYLFAFSENSSPSNSLQGALLDVMAHLSDTADQSKTSTQKSQKKPKKSQSKSKKSQQEPKSPGVRQSEAFSFVNPKKPLHSEFACSGFFIFFFTSIWRRKPPERRLPARGEWECAPRCASVPRRGTAAVLLPD